MLLWKLKTSTLNVWVMNGINFLRVLLTGTLRELALKSYTSIVVEPEWKKNHQNYDEQQYIFDFLYCQRIRFFRCQLFYCIICCRVQLIFFLVISGNIHHAENVSIIALCQAVVRARWRLFEFRWVNQI